MSKPLIKKNIESVDDLYNYLQSWCDNHNYKPSGIIIHYMTWDKFVSENLKYSYHRPENLPHRFWGLSIFRTLDLEYGQVIVF